MITLVHMSFPDYLEKQFVEWQQREGRRKTIADFANFIGVSQAVVSLWMNGSRKPNSQSIELLADIFGLEVYDALGLPRPDPDLHYIQSHWENYTATQRRALREQAEGYKAGNETKRSPEKRRTKTP